MMRVCDTPPIVRSSRAGESFLTVTQRSKTAFWLTSVARPFCFAFRPNGWGKFWNRASRICERN